MSYNEETDEALKSYLKAAQENAALYDFTDMENAAYIQGYLDGADDNH